MTIRRASYDEAKAIKGWDEFVGDRRIDNWRGEMFVAEESGEVVAYITYSSNLFYNRPFISLLCVKPSHRRRGIGRLLVKQVLAAYTGLEVWVSTEEWNEAAVALFQSMKFKKMGAIKGLNRDESTEAYFVHREEAEPSSPGDVATRAAPEN
jgi:ribosomal protein S18 acetylase RimI-like enzyme